MPRPHRDCGGGGTVGVRPRETRKEARRERKKNEEEGDESFNGKFRDECLNEAWLTSLNDAKRTSEQGRRDYNEVRPHSALANQTPLEFATAVGRSD